MELLGALVGLSILAQVSVAIVAGLLFPAFWVWMLVDAITRRSGDFPSSDDAEKIVWVIVMLVLQPAAILYFFLVKRACPRSQQAPVAPTAPVAVAG